MGIQGLLPKLKSIRRTRHLDEYNGKTVAVDGYAWLHMGVHTCATELALEKPTNKYVDYMMSRVRIMRHHGIVPYIVFDGGPLPAKKGTELEREKKRKESLEKAKKLHEAGKHSEARKSFATCVDVSPQMAYQCIKALKAQGVQYVVAPYEADAQLAYLERTGAVDAILTIDSDLLVFGGKDVLYDLDVHNRTVNSYRRADFGAVRADGIMLAGWSDAQFRTWAIMSGCDYLPNIPGVAIKGAYNALREHKTVENVVRNFKLNGRQVPRDYLAKFNLAEKCFLHQRVYDPDVECLVHFSPVDSAEWNDTLDLHVGPPLEASIAKGIAEGDVCPITLLPMKDINPGFNPQGALVFVKDKGKAKAKDQGPVGILNFFGPKATIPPRTRSPTKKTALRPSSASAQKTHIAATGKSSGKRTLSEAMDEGIRIKKQRASVPGPSKYFSLPSSPSRGRNSLPTPGPSQIVDEKENFDPDDPESDDSVRAVGNVDAEMELEIEEVLLTQAHIVDQEDGYISPAESQGLDSDVLSSPCRPSHRSQLDVLATPGPSASRRTQVDMDDVLSSPGAASPSRPHSFQSIRLSSSQSSSQGAPPALDLSKILGVSRDDDEIDEASSAVGDDDNDVPAPTQAQPSEEEEDVDVDFKRRQALVSEGWLKQYGFKGREGATRDMMLRRSDTNVTPVGRHRPRALHTPLSAPAAGSRKSLVFNVDSIKRKGSPLIQGREGGGKDNGKTGLERFRYQAL